MLSWYMQSFFTDYADGYTKQNYLMFLGDGKDFIDQIPSPLKELAAAPQENIIFDENAFEDLQITARKNAANQFPYRIKIKFPQYGKCDYGTGEVISPSRAGDFDPENAF